MLACSSARAVTLGNAAVLSALDQPLRVAIPLVAAPGEVLAADCFSVVRPAAEGPAIVTAKVSLERPAAAPRLLVSTSSAISEPAVRLAVQGGCESTERRDYVLLLDPPAPTAYQTPAAVAATSAPAARVPRQENAAPAGMSAAARRDSPESSGTGARRIAQRPVWGETASRAPSAGDSAAAAERALASAASLRSGLRPVAATGETVRGALPRKAAPAGNASADSSADSWWTIAVALGGFLVVIAGAILVRHGRSQPAVPEWSHQMTSTGPRSITNLSAMPVLLSSGPAKKDATATRGPAVTLPDLTVRSRLGRTAPSSLRTISSSASARGGTEPTSDELLDDIEADLIELRQARAARREKKQDQSNAILQAIEAAERDLLLDAPTGDAAMERSLEDELKVPKVPEPGPKKAAA